MSADKIVKSLASDDKIARAVQQPGTRKTSDKRMSFEQNIAAQDEDDEEEEEEEDEEENVEGVEGKEAKERRADKPNKGPKIWDQWSKWSACSVTCGIGKITRWRHCVSGGCAPGEKEAQIKTCTLPSC
ncbi:Thrombospondin type 1 domain [Popillia japonica]|uniref:Thrombospondin type 1 domain n=1 Tax=Popillia japonica TaxID=7064 RepID=A0AAW1HS33_POPJA